MVVHLLLLFGSSRGMLCEYMRAKCRSLIRFVPLIGVIKLHPFTHNLSITFGKLEMHVLWILLFYEAESMVEYIALNLKRKKRVELSERPKFQRIFISSSFCVFADAAKFRNR